MDIVEQCTLLSVSAKKSAIVSVPPKKSAIVVCSVFERQQLQACECHQSTEEDIVHNHKYKRQCQPL